MKELYLVSCCRTAVGSFQGSLANTPASDLGAVVVKAALERAGLKPELRAAGELRLEHPEATLSELGKLADPPLSKDALAGRLRRLCKKAQEAAKAEKGKKPKR